MHGQIGGRCEANERIRRTEAADNPVGFSSSAVFMENQTNQKLQDCSRVIGILISGPRDFVNC